MAGAETPTKAFSDSFNGGLAAHCGLAAMSHGDGNRWPWAYFNLAGEQAAGDFDRAGPIEDGGAGFVCKDGKPFRIQFGK